MFVAGASGRAHMAWWGIWLGKSRMDQGCVSGVGRRIGMGKEDFACWARVISWPCKRPICYVREERNENLGLIFGAAVGLVPVCLVGFFRPAKMS